MACQGEQGLTGRSRLWSQLPAKDRCVPVVPSAMSERPVHDDTDTLGDTGMGPQTFPLECQDRHGRRFNPGMRCFDPGPTDQRGVVPNHSIEVGRLDCDGAAFLLEEPGSGPLSRLRVHLQRVPEQDRMGRRPVWVRQTGGDSQRAVGVLQSLEPVSPSLDCVSPCLR